MDAPESGIARLGASYQPAQSPLFELERGTGHFLLSSLIAHALGYLDYAPPTVITYPAAFLTFAVRFSACSDPPAKFTLVTNQMAYSLRSSPVHQSYSTPLHA
jgi:hypothetical protein